MHDSTKPIFRKPSTAERECLFELMLAACHYAYDVKDSRVVAGRMILGPITQAAYHLDALERGIGRSA